MKEGYVLKADAAKYLTPEPITYAAMKRKSEKSCTDRIERCEGEYLERSRNREG